ncbi:hypothetical protein [Streptomyces vinaceus]|uniref:hypothetical protein n=1 Tax=Streptomyces vinaceus TaxID=1960 RepID=UPI00380878AC
MDLSGSVADYEAYLVIRDEAVPLPEELTALLTELVRVFDDLADQEPLTALKALADLRYVIAQTGAVYELSARDVPLEKIATALGTSETAARSYVTVVCAPRRQGSRAWNLPHTTFGFGTDLFTGIPHTLGVSCGRTSQRRGRPTASAVASEVQRHVKWPYALRQPGPPAFSCPRGC